VVYEGVRQGAGQFGSRMFSLSDTIRRHSQIAILGSWTGLYLSIPSSEGSQSQLCTKFINFYCRGLRDTSNHEVGRHHCIRVSEESLYQTRVPLQSLNHWDKGRVHLDCRLAGALE
jgi:hypothetical protein